MRNNQERGPLYPYSIGYRPYDNKWYTYDTRDVTQQGPDRASAAEAGADAREMHDKDISAV